MFNVPCNQTVVAIANPTAGPKSRKRKNQTWSSKLPQNTQLQIANSSQETEDLAKKASESGCPMVIAVGGDGTVHSVVNGLMCNPENRSSMGIVATGTANDYERSLRRYRTRQASDSMLVDVGRLRWGDRVRYFVNVAGIGLPSRVAKHAELFRGLPARVRYSLAVLRCLRSGLSANTMEVMIEGENQGGFIQEQLLMMSLAIGTREGSFEMAAQARFDDGLFNSLKVGKLSRWDLLYYFPGVLRGKIPTSDPRIRSGTCREVKLRSLSPIALHLDGEFPDVTSGGINDCTLDILHRHLSVQLY